MLVRTWRFITLLLTALSAAMAFCHLLEMPAKMRYDGLLYATVQKSLYRAFGTVGACIEIAALLAAAVLSFLVRTRRPAFRLTLTSTACPAAAFAAWVVLIAPVNAEVNRWTPESVPTEWPRLRARWEYTHVARAILLLAGLSALVLSILFETPAELPRDHAD